MYLAWQSVHGPYEVPQKYRSQFRQDPHCATDVATADVATADVATVDVATADVATADVHQHPFQAKAPHHGSAATATATPADGLLESDGAYTGSHSLSSADCCQLTTNGNSPSYNGSVANLTCAGSSN
jgi:hypothetical protein